MSEASVKQTVQELEDILPDEPSSTYFRGYYWVLAEQAFFWHDPPSGAGMIHYSDGREPTFEFPDGVQYLLLKKTLVVNGCIDALCGLLSKIDFITSLWRNNQITEDSWFRYVQTDIHAFHAELRSLFDTIALLLKHLVMNNQSGDSFHWYREAVSIFSKKKIENRLAIPHIYRNLILGTDWFDQLCATRDSIMHNELDASVFWRSDGHIMFKLSYAETLNATELEHNSCLRHFLWRDCILFEPYAGYYFGRMIHLLNTLSLLLAQDLKFELTPFASWCPTLHDVPLRYTRTAFKILKDHSMTPSERFRINRDTVKF